MGNPLVVQDDARRLRDLGFKPESVDCLVTSPPYFNLKRYDRESTLEVGQNQSLEEYVADIEQIFSACWDLAKQTGVLWLIADTLRLPAEGGGLGELEPLPFRLAASARAAGWRLQEIVIWEKNKTLPYSGQGKLRNLIEYVLLFTKSQDFKHRPFRLAQRHGVEAEWLSGWPERYHPLGKRPSNIWKIPIPTQGMWAHSERLHFCPLPQSLVARCIELTTDKGDLVLDPFAGIGTVPAQAEAMGRQGRGVELNPAFVEIFEERILPSFQATWESEAEARHMSRGDQLREAETILILRALKAGKELARMIDRWAHEELTGSSALGMESVVVQPTSAITDHLDVEAGRVDRLPVKLTVLTDTAGKETERLADITDALGKPPFSTFGLELSVEIQTRDDFMSGPAGASLHEFEQSRRASFTKPVSLGPKSRLPRLLSTVALDRVIEGDNSRRWTEFARRPRRDTLPTSSLWQATYRTWPVDSACPKQRCAGYCKSME